MTRCDTLTGAESEVHIRVGFGGKPQRDWSLVMGTKRSVSNASRKLAAVVKELVVGGARLCEGESWF